MGDLKVELFAKNLRYLRHKVGLTQNELSKIIDVAQSNINNYERANFFPSIHTLIKICNFYRLNIDALVRWDVEKRVKDGRIKLKGGVWDDLQGSEGISVCSETKQVSVGSDRAGHQTDQD